MKQKSKWF